MQAGGKGVVLRGDITINNWWWCILWFLHYYGFLSFLLLGVVGCSSSLIKSVLVERVQKKKSSVFVSCFCPLFPRDLISEPRCVQLNTMQLSFLTTRGGHFTQKKTREKANKQEKRLLGIEWHVLID